MGEDKNIVKKSEKVLTTKKEIAFFLGVGKNFLPILLALGLPVASYGGKCFAHTENLEEFMKARTRHQDLGGDEEE